MLALLLSCLVGFSGLKAQSNSEYSFRQQSTILGDSFAPDDDNAPILRMNCLAANGFGQWTLSSQAGTGPTADVEFPSGWYLLANGLYKPSTEFVASNPDVHPGCFPPGVVQCGSFSFPTEVKATVNLDGMSGFLSPDQTTRQVFDASGFTASDVDLSFSFLQNPVPPPSTTPPANTFVITHAILSWPTISTEKPTGMTHDVISETDFRDNYDWCADAHFIYIVWASSTNSLVPSQEEVWVTVVPIGSGTPVAGFPMEINDGTNFDGKFPTITCDSRSNRSGTPTPAFDIAYIQPSTGNIMVSNSGGAAFPLAGTFWDPTVPSPGSMVPWEFATHARILRNSVLSGTSSLAVYAIVFCNTSKYHSSLHLIYYDPMHLGGTADYVAGNIMASPSPIFSTPLVPVFDAPITAFADPYDDQAAPQKTDEFHCLYQYDLGSGTSPLEFPLCIVRSSDIAAAFPDLYPTFTPDPSSQDTRLVLNQSLGILGFDPTNHWYVGAMNQMGIHVHWIDITGTHFYARDMNRTFDEDIDENTLVTDQCTVSDGTIHGGTVGAMLHDNKRMSIWTDPNYGADLSDHTGNIGLWQPGDLHPVGSPIDPMVGTLNFIGNNVNLQIGGMGISDAGAVLTDMPYFYCNFSAEFPNEGITVGPNSTVDYYGLIANHNSDGSIKDGTTTLPKIGSPFVVNGISSAIGGSGIITLHGDATFDDAPPYNQFYPATLNIHGGSDFGIGSGGQLQSVYEGNIQVLYDGNVYPLPPATPRKVTGHATLHGQSYIEESTVEGHIPADSAADVPIISVRGYWEGRIQFLSGSTWYSNQNIHGVCEIQMEPELKPADQVEFDTDDFSAVRIHYIDPEVPDPTFFGDPGGLVVDNSAFNYQHGRSIFVESNEDPTGGDAAVITINNNYFDYMDTHDRNTDPDDAAHGTFGIYIKGLNANYNGAYPDLVGTVLVQDNTFHMNNWSWVNPSYPTVSNLQYAAAICFENTTGNIIGNTISDPGYTKGIWLMASPWEGSYPLTNTYVCSNTIENLYPQAGGTTPAPELLTGIRTEYHTGLIKLNSITNCEVGILATGIGHNYLAYNMIDNYSASSPHTYDIQQAIQITSPSATNFLDLSGQHGSTSSPPDNGGFNTIRATYDDWSTGMITIGSNSQLVLDNEFEGFTWTQYGQNNIFLANAGFPNPGTSTQPTATNAYTFKGQGTSAASFPSLDFNFWGIDGSGNKIDPANGVLHWNGALGTSQNNSSNISITTLPSSTLGSESTFTGIACLPSEQVRTKRGAVKPQSGDSAPTGCQLSFNLGMGLSNEGQYAASYDTLRNFVQTCPTHYYAPSAFSIMSEDVQYGGDGPQPQCWIDFRNWLLSAFAWNPNNPTYFCADVHALGGTFGSPYDTSYTQQNTATNKSESVLYWILHNPLCTNGPDSELYQNGRGDQIEVWLHTQDTSKVQLDTTIYSMHDLGLDSILKYAALLGVHEPGMESILSNATAYPNPTGEGTELSFTTNKEAYVLVKLYNVLGQAEGATSFEDVLEPGSHQVPISLAGLAPGMYYAHIQTTYGEVQTVKLVKE